MEFSKEDVQMANKYTKNCSTALAIEKMKIKNTLRFHLIPLINIINSTLINNTHTKEQILVRML
jgi:hypothetical protein